MKNFLSLLSIMLLMATMASAQTFKKGDNVVSAGIGLGGTYGFPITVNYEKGVYDLNDCMSIGVGGVIGYGFDSEKVAGLGKWSYSNLLIGATGAWHYTQISKLDLSVGLTLGYDIASAKWKYDSGLNAGEPAEGSIGGFLWGFNAGAKYYFTEEFGASLGVGYGMSYASLGVCYKF